MLDIEIRRQLLCYMANEISLQDFRDWFISATWNVERTGNIIAQEVAHEIELRFAEFSNGHWAEQELRRKLRPLTEVCTVKVSFGTSATAALDIDFTSSAQTQPFGIVLSGAFV